MILTVPAAVALTALAAVVIVLVLVVADHTRYIHQTASEPEGPVVIDQAGRLVACTEELPVYTAGRHRAPGWW